MSFNEKDKYLAEINIMAVKPGVADFGRGARFSAISYEELKENINKWLDSQELNKVLE